MKAVKMEEGLDENLAYLWERKQAIHLVANWVGLMGGLLAARKAEKSEHRSVEWQVWLMVWN